MAYRLKFEIEAGVLNRNTVRRELENSKKKLEYWYPKCTVLLTEDKTWFESFFHFEAKNLPDESESKIRSWIRQIEEFAIKESYDLNPKINLEIQNIIPIFTST